MELSYETHEERELRLQLNHIDQQLKFRSNGTSHIDNAITYHKNHQQGQHKLAQRKDAFEGVGYFNNFEYFSQIGNQDADEDSLFDPTHNFLVASEPLISHQPIQQTQICKIQQKKQVFPPQHDVVIKSKNGQNNVKLANQPHITKEREYAYRKQTDNQIPAVHKNQLPPKSRKNSGEKLSRYVPTSSLRGAKNNTVQDKSPQTEMQRYFPNQQQRFRTEQDEKNNILQTQDIQYETLSAYLQKTLGGNSKSTSSRPQIKSKYQKEDHNKPSLECTFKPTILKKSQRMAKSTKNVVERLSTVQPKGGKKPYQPTNNKLTLNKQRLDQLSQPRKLKTQAPQLIQQTPSFRPSLSKKSLQQMSNCTYDVATRNQLWLEQREEKIERLRQQQEKYKLQRQGCTHSPSLCQYKGDNDPGLSRFGKEGIANYFERLSVLNKSGVGKCDQQKQNIQSAINHSKGSLKSTKGKKQNYEQAVRQLHNRILNLKI